MKLVVANEGSERTGLENMVRKLGIDRNVKFVGFLSTVEQTNWYSRAKYYISIPTSDSTSASLLEAMSFGCTPIVSDIPANREWVEPDRTGLLFSDELSFDKLKALSAFSLNREIILRRAIWKDNVLQFLNTLNQIENEAGLRTSKRM
jgi:glycosyltransferase involved in cell wall biosynthesis